MDLGNLITRSSGWINQSDNFVGEPIISGGNRHRLSGACFHLSREHHAAIVYLVEGEYFGSAFAMIRPLLESYVRGIWLFRCATDNQLEKFVAKNLIPGLGKLISEIEIKPGYAGGVLNEIKVRSLRTMHGFTHGGIEQLSRRVGDGSLEPNYQLEDIIKAVDFANVVGGLARLESLLLCNQNDRSQEFLDIFKKHVSKPSK
jgi:hypothetical protein